MLLILVIWRKLFEPRGETFLSSPFFSVIRDLACTKESCAPQKNGYQYLCPSMTVPFTLERSRLLRFTMDQWIWFGWCADVSQSTILDPYVVCSVELRWNIKRESGIFRLFFSALRTTLWLHRNIVLNQTSLTLLARGRPISLKSCPVDLFLLYLVHELPWAKCTEDINWVSMLYSISPPLHQNLLGFQRKWTGASHNSSHLILHIDTIWQFTAIHIFL